MGTRSKGKLLMYDSIQTTPKDRDGKQGKIKVSLDRRRITQGAFGRRSVMPAFYSPTKLKGKNQKGGI